MIHTDARSLLRTGCDKHRFKNSFRTRSIAIFLLCFRTRSSRLRLVRRITRICTTNCFYLISPSCQSRQHLALFLTNRSFSYDSFRTTFIQRATREAHETTSRRCSSTSVESTKKHDRSRNQRSRNCNFRLPPSSRSDLWPTNSSTKETNFTSTTLTIRRQASSFRIIVVQRERNGFERRGSGKNVDGCSEGI